MRAASAAPAAMQRPWPSEPVVKVYAVKCRFRVDTQHCVVSAESIEARLPEASSQRMCGVEGEAGRVLWRDKAVPIGIVG